MAEELTPAIEETSPIETDITETIVEPSVDYSANEVASTSIETPDNIDDLYNDFIKPNNYFSSSDEFRTFISDPKNAKDFFKDAIAPEKLFSNENEFIQFIGVKEPGKPSAVPSPSVSGGSATKGRGVEQPSMSPQLSSEASLDNIQKTLQVYADGQGAFPETLSAADVKELRKQVPGGELPNISDEKVAKMLAGKSPKQVRIASVNAIPDIKERKTEQARMYKDFSREKSAENQQLDQNIKTLEDGMYQIRGEGINLYQQLQNPNIDPQTASMLSEQLQQTQANYNRAASDYNSELEKYQQNARFIKTMGAGVQSNLKGLIPSTIINPRSPSDVMAASAWNATAPALLKTLGAVIDVLPSPLPTDRNVVSDAIFNLADKVSVDVAKYSPQANVSLMDDVNVYNTSQLLGNLLGSVAMTFGGGAAAGATGAQAAGFSQVYGDVYKQGRDAGLTKAESMFFAMPTGIVAAYLGDKGVESLAGAFSKTSLKSAIKQGAKELAEKRTPQMMMEFGKKVLLNTLEGAGKEGAQEGLEFATEFGSKKLASLKEDVKFKDDLSLEGFGKGLAESAIAGAAGGGLLGPFFGAGRNKAFADVVNKAARDPEAEIDFMEQLDASVVANDITPEQKQQMVEMLEKTKQAAATVPPVVESEPARAEATALVLEQQDLQEQIEQTNPAMAKPLQDRLDAINTRLGEIAEGKNLPTEEEAPQAKVAPVVDALKDVQSTKEALTTKTIQEISDSSGILFPLSDDAPTIISERYHKAKADGSNPELVNAIESVLAPQPAPQTLPEVTNVIATLREMEQAEYADIDPNDEEKRKQIYDRYDTIITPLLEKEKELTVQASLEENGVSLQGVKFSDIVVDDKYLEDILDENKLSDEEKKQVREVFTRGVTYFKFDKEGEQKFQEKFANPEDITDVADIITGVSAAEESNFNNYNTTNYENVKDAINYIVNNPNDYSPNVVKALTEIKEKLDNPSSSMSRLYAVDVMKELGISEPTPTAKAQAPVAEEAKAEAAPTSEQAPQPFPAQEGAESVQDKFQANAELEQIYRDLNAAVTKNVDKDTIRMLKANPTEAMVNKAMEELKRKGVIKIDCK
jgi:hypothetical protein